MVISFWASWCSHWRAPVVPMLVDAKRSVGRLYHVDDPPLTLLVDRDGRVRGAWAGDTKTMPELARQIKELQSQ